MMISCKKISERKPCRDADPTTRGNLPAQPMPPAERSGAHRGGMAAPVADLAFLRHSRGLRRPRQSRQGETQMHADQKDARGSRAEPALADAQPVGRASAIGVIPWRAILSINRSGMRAPMSLDRKSTRLNSSHPQLSRMPSSA